MTSFIEFMSECFAYFFRFMNMTRMSYGEAALTCHDTNKSLPLYLEDAVEESFIVSQILETFAGTLWA